MVCALLCNTHVRYKQLFPRTRFFRVLLLFFPCNNSFRCAVKFARDSDCCVRIASSSWCPSYSLMPHVLFVSSRHLGQSSHDRRHGSKCCAVRAKQWRRWNLFEREIKIWGLSCRGGACGRVGEDREERRSVGSCWRSAGRRGQRHSGPGDRLEPYFYLGAGRWNINAEMPSDPSTTAGIWLRPIPPRVAM